MGVKFDRVLDAFDGPFEKIADLITPAPGKVAQAPNGGGYLLSHQVNDAFVAVNRLLKANEDVYWIKSAFVGERQAVPGRHDVHPGEAVDDGDRAEAGDGQGSELRCDTRLGRTATR